MKAQDVDNFLARWLATLSPAFAPAYVDGYFRRHRTEIEALVVRALAERAARHGERPEDAVDFLAYDAVIAAQRLVDARPDRQVLQLLMRDVDAQFSEGYAEWAVYGNFAVEYVDTRTEAILLRDAGWDVMPLLVDSPSLAIIAGGHLVALRDPMGWLNIHPDRRGTLNHLYADIRRAEEKTVDLREAVGIRANTKERLAKYAIAMWKRARKATKQVTAPRNAAARR
ncbi:MAG: hypothetical protein H7066_11345 [Cytophagaceae bacterium]|nr:hypothetical protein [Gemmatimonadaceae bacterium]